MPSFSSGANTPRSNVPGNNPSVRVMLVDDSAVIRGLIKRMLDPEPDIEVVASVSNGELAVKRMEAGGIDVIILDIEMPIMDGLTALPKLVAIDRKVKIIMASTLTLENAEISIEAMKMGAADYVPKPTSTSKIGGASEFRDGLVSKIKALGGVLYRSPIAKPSAPAPAPAPAPSPARVPAPATGKPEAKPAMSKLAVAAGKIELRPSPAHFPPEIVAIGSSTGGPQALFEVLKNISPSVQVPILITQHMPPTFTTILAKHISTSVGRECTEGVDGEIIKAGHIYLAPGDFHMVVETQGINKIIRLNQNPPENFCRPAADPMFRSISSAYKGRILTVVLTGMGSDGSKGAQVIADGGGTVVAQDENTSVVWGMPSAAAALGICSAILPLQDVASYINQFVAKGRA